MKIEARHNQAILLISQGMKNSYIAEELKVTPETVSRWKSDYNFKAQLNAVLLDNNSHAQDRLRSLTTMALDTIESIMNDAKIPPKERLTAALKILELNKVNAGTVGSTNPEVLQDEQEQLDCLSINSLEQFLN